MSRRCDQSRERFEDASPLTEDGGRGNEPGNATQKLEKAKIQILPEGLQRGLGPTDNLTLVQ